MVVEELVDEAVIRADPNRTIIPGLIVDAVVVEPWGAHPSYVQGAYDRDNRFYLDWDPITRDEATTQAWLREWVYDLDGRAAYMDKLGAERIAGLRPGGGAVGQRRLRGLPMTAYVGSSCATSTGSIAFYTSRLGFVLVRQSRVRVRDGPPRRPRAVAERAAQRLVDGRSPTGASRHPVAGRGSCCGSMTWRPAWRPLRAAGVTFRNEIVHGPGGDQVVIDDPDGNAIEIFQPNDIR